MSTNAQRLNHLIDDLLILGQAEIGATMMHPEPTDLMTIIDAVKAIAGFDREPSGLPAHADDYIKKPFGAQ